MAGNVIEDWRSAHGGALPFRPPTVDEAIPYSPFTSIVPFSPGELLLFTSTLPPAFQATMAVTARSIPLT